MINSENYQFLQNLYWDLILHFTKLKDDKVVEQLQKSWEEVEELFGKVTHTFVP